MEVGTYHYDFVSTSLHAPKGNNTIWVIVERLTMSSHFLPIKTDVTLKQLAELYAREIMGLHGVLVSIVFDQDVHFVAMFWKSLHKALRTTFNLLTILKLIGNMRERFKH